MYGTFCIEQPCLVLGANIVAMRLLLLLLLLQVTSPFPDGRRPTLSENLRGGAYGTSDMAYNDMDV